MTEADLLQLIDIGHETRGVEFKSAGRRDDGYTLALVTRAILAMSNHRGGGLIIVGVSEENKKLVTTGLSTDELGTWDYDTLCDQVGQYADPSVSFDLEVVPAKTLACAVITVHEFRDMPILCKTDSSFAADAARGRLGPVTLLRRGAIYVRPLRKPASQPIETTEDMRELIELATEKAVARYRALRAIEDGEKGLGKPGPQELYDNELKDFR